MYMTVSGWTGRRKRSGSIQKRHKGSRERGQGLLQSQLQNSNSDEVSGRKRGEESSKCSDLITLLVAGVYTYKNVLLWGSHANMSPSGAVRRTRVLEAELEQI